MRPVSRARSLSAQLPRSCPAMPRHTFARTTCLLLTALVFVGCGDDDDDDTAGPGNETWPGPCIISEACNGAQIGEVTASVSGDVNEPVTGGAVFTEEADGSWRLTMGIDWEGESGIYLAGDGGRPATGIYAFDAGTAELSAAYLHGASEALYLAEEGELVVTQSSPSRVTGGFEFTASDADGNVVTVEGTFDAPKGEGTVI